MPCNKHQENVGEYEKDDIVEIKAAFKDAAIVTDVAARKYMTKYDMVEDINENGFISNS